MTNSRRAQVLLHVCAGGAVVLASILADDILGRSRGWGLTQFTVLAAGLVILAMGLVRPIGLITRASTKLCMSVLSLFLCLAVAEWCVRVTGFAFFHEEEAWRKIPIFYRIPTEPTGEVFFRRPGPDRWSGQVLNTHLHQLGVLPNPYANEPVVTVEYDRRGFRNPNDMSDWHIAVAGDSHTEMGYLPHEQLFTSVMAKRLNVPVLNLGTSDTGPLTYLHYLEKYGMSPSTRHLVIVFFEGNDLSDLAIEHDALIRWTETGQRDYRQVGKDPSFVRPLYVFGRWLLYALSRRGEAEYVSGYFRSSQGAIPITLLYTPPGSSELPAETRRHLDDFLRKYAQFERERRVEAWLAYMPAERRVLHDRIDFSASAPARFKNWQPTDLPDAVAALCAQYGIGFIDLTTALMRETNQSGQLLYNSIYDMHLNAHGSRVVGQELARHFAGLLDDSPAVRPLTTGMSVPQ